MAGTDPDLLDLLLHSARAVEARLEAGLAEIGLTGSRYQVLRELAAAGEAIPLGELAARASCVRSNMTQLVDRMEKDGLVRRVGDPHDRRAVRAELTARGRERERAGARALATLRGQVLGAVPAAQRLALERLLAALA